MKRKLRHLWFVQRKSHFLLTLFISGMVVWLIYGYANYSPSVPAYDTASQRRAHALLMAQYPNNTQGCSIPKLKVNDPLLAGYYSKTATLNCVSDADWVQLIDGRLYVLHEGTICSYKPFERVSDYQVEFGEERFLTSGVHLRDEFVRVFCKDSKGNSYTTVFAKPIPREVDVTQVPRDFRRRKFLRSLHLNVLFIGFDSVSRMTSLRKLPKTHQVLKTLNAVVLEGYNIVGDGTPQALVPILTGRSEIELPNVRKRDFPKSQYVNAYPMIWDVFKEAGYVTAFAEDNVNYGVFTYRFNGFNPQPTDHYFRTLYLEAIKDRRGVMDLCVGGRKAYQVQFNYTMQLWDVYKDRRKFAFSFVDLCHDDINLCGDADDYLVWYLNTLHAKGYLDDTVVFLMSDHGARFSTAFKGQYRNTQQGKLEERLPLFAVLVPTSLRQKHTVAYKNLQANAHRLTSPFDVHATLLDLLDFAEGKRSVEFPSRSISLFDRIPDDRSCLQADIEPHWCSCLQWKNISISSSVAQTAALRFVDAINSWTAGVRDLCAVLTLHNLNEALMYGPDKSVLTFKGAGDLDGYIAKFSDDSLTTEVMLQLKLVTVPGHALYEASIVYNVQKMSVNADPSQVSILTKYGDNPHCVLDKEGDLRKFCVCHDMA